MSHFFTDDATIKKLLKDFVTFPTSETPVDWKRTLIFNNRHDIHVDNTPCLMMSLEAFIQTNPHLQHLTPLFNDAEIMCDKLIYIFFHNDWYSAHVSFGNLQLIRGASNTTLMTRDILHAPGGMDPLSQVVL